MANKVQITMSQHELNKKLSVDSTVQQSLDKLASRISRMAQGYLAAHRKTGAHSIKVETNTSKKYGHIDWYVVLEGPAAASVEFGHFTPNKTRYVAGLYILTMAMLNARI